MLKDAGRRAGISLPANVDALISDPARCDRRALMGRIAALPCTPQLRFRYLIAFNASGRFRRRWRFKLRRLHGLLTGQTELRLALLYMETQKRIMECEKRALARRR